MRSIFFYLCTISVSYVSLLPISYAETNSNVKLIKSDTVFTQRGTRYKRVTNVYVAHQKAVDAAKVRLGDAIESTSGQPQTDVAAFAQKQFNQRVVATKGQFVIVVHDILTDDRVTRDTTYDTTTDVNVPSIADKAVLINVASDTLAVLSDTAIVGVKDAEQARSIAKTYGLELITLVGSQQLLIAIYRGTINTILERVALIRENENVRFIEADIVEQFAVPR